MRRQAMRISFRTSIIVSMKTFTYRWYLRLSAPLLWCPTTLMRFERHPPSKQPGKVPLWNETKWNWHHSWVSMHVRLCKNMDCYTYTPNGRWTKYFMVNNSKNGWWNGAGDALCTRVCYCLRSNAYTPPTPHVSERASLLFVTFRVWLATLSLPI